MSVDYDIYSDVFLNGSSSGYLYKAWACLMVWIYGQNWKGWKRDFQPKVSNNIQINTWYCDQVRSKLEMFLCYVISSTRHFANLTKIPNLPDLTPKSHLTLSTKVGSIVQSSLLKFIIGLSCLCQLAISSYDEKKTQFPWNSLILSPALALSLQEV